MFGAVTELVPELLGDERHHRVQKLHGLAEHKGSHGARLVLLRAVGALQHGLGELDIPVADDAPDKLMERARGVVQPEVADCSVDRGVGARQFAQHPFVDREPHAGRIEALRQRGAVHFGEARGVPQLGRKVARALDAG